MKLVERKTPQDQQDRLGYFIEDELNSSENNKK